MAFFFGHSVTSPNVSVDIYLIEQHRFNFSFSLDNFGRRTTYHVSEFIHPESVAPSTIISLHIVFSDFINIPKPNQLPENLFTHKKRQRTGQIGPFLFRLRSLSKNTNNRLKIILWIKYKKNYEYFTVLDIHQKMTNLIVSFYCFLFN